MPNGTSDSQGNALSETRSSVTPYTCETEIPFGRQMSGGSDNAMSSARARVFDMAWWPNGMEVRCPAAFARTGCRWVTATARSTPPTLTNNRIIVNPSTDDPRTAIPFGRETQTLTRKCGQTRMRQAVTREGGHAKRNPRLARERVIENRTLPSLSFETEFAEPYQGSIGKINLIWSTSDLDDFENGKLNILNKDEYYFPEMDVRPMDFEYQYKTEKNNNDEIILELRIKNLSSQMKKITVYIFNNNDNYDKEFILIGIDKQTCLIGDNEEIKGCFEFFISSCNLCL